jgi:transposase
MQNFILLPKVFFEEIKVQDFPIRGKGVYLFIRRRRWVDKEGKIYQRNWELVAQGTRMTKEFAAFLKVIHRYQTGKL